ncbi:hypothetical protein BD309DRAFT_823385, partial [Dichomitus squalens]
MHRGFAPRAGPSRVEDAGYAWVPHSQILISSGPTSLTPHLLPPANFRGTALGISGLYFLYHHSTTPTRSRTLAFPFDTHTQTLVHAPSSDDDIADWWATARRARGSGCAPARRGCAGGRERRERGPRARRRRERSGRRDGEHGDHLRDCWGEVCSVGAYRGSRALRGLCSRASRFVSGWEDVDVSDASFMLQSRVQVLRMLLRSETVSLYALNAPARDVTPLGLAAWLNVPDAIRVLLEESRGLVAVDGTDSLGVTPLMYTARDGAVEAASILLANGARPDLRDTHHRTAIHHALRHPRMLWLCESTLRKQRLREYLNGNRRQLQPLPQPYVAYAQTSATSPVDLTHWPAPSEVVLSRSTEALIRAVAGSDLTAIYQVLFPASHRTTVLVNRLDSQGWGPLHYCVTS